jgi:hypothetical protein
MSAEPIARVLDRLRDRARQDDALAETLTFLADDRDVDPFARPSEAVLAGVRRVNARRQGARRRALAAGSLSTAEVVDLISSVSDRRAVDRRRRRGRLLGVKVGNTMLHPDWQFDHRRGDTRAGLDRVLEALGEVTSDPAAAHALMIAARPELGGRSLAALFADGDVDRAVQLVLMAGDQS